MNILLWIVLGAAAGWLASLIMGRSGQNWAINLALALPAAAIAVLSWWTIEKPALGLRRYLMRGEAWYAPKLDALARRLFGRVPGYGAVADR